VPFTVEGHHKSRAQSGSYGSQSGSRASASRRSKRLSLTVLAQLKVDPHKSTLVQSLRRVGAREDLQGTRELKEALAAFDPVAQGKAKTGKAPESKSGPEPHVCSLVVDAIRLPERDPQVRSQDARAAAVTSVGH
jgi:hypothetical protein